MSRPFTFLLHQSKTWMPGTRPGMTGTQTSSLVAAKDAVLVEDDAAVAGEMILDPRHAAAVEAAMRALPPIA
jgi:hypothetical protein